MTDNINYIDLLKKEEEKHKSKVKTKTCPACGKPLVFMTVPGSRERAWIHKVGVSTCSMRFSSPKDIEAYQETAGLENASGMPGKSSKVKSKSKEKPSEPAEKQETEDIVLLKEDCSKESVQPAQDEGDPKDVLLKDEDVAEEPGTEIENTVTITLAQYGILGGDNASIEQLLSGIDKLFNNVDRHAFELVDEDDEDEEETVTTQKSMPRLTGKRLKSKLNTFENSKDERGEEDLEKRAHVTDGKITITTTYTPQEEFLLKEKEKAERKVEPYVIYNDKAYFLSKNGSDDFTIGRSDNNDIVVKLSAVSSHHAVIKKTAGKYYLQDQSSNGTLIEIDGIKYRAPKGKMVELKPKTKIILPDSVLVFIC